MSTPKCDKVQQDSKLTSYVTPKTVKPASSAALSTKPSNRPRYRRCTMNDSLPSPGNYSNGSRTESFREFMNAKLQGSNKTCTTASSSGSHSKKSQASYQCSAARQEDKASQEHSREPVQHPQAGFYIYTHNNLDESFSSLEASMRSYDMNINRGSVKLVDIGLHPEDMSLGSFDRPRRFVKEEKEHEGTVGSPTGVDEFGTREGGVGKKTLHSVPSPRRRASGKIHVPSLSPSVEEVVGRNTEHQTHDKVTQSSANSPRQCKADRRRRRFSDCGITHGRPTVINSGGRMKVVNDDNWKQVYDNLMASRGGCSVASGNSPSPSIKEMLYEHQEFLEGVNGRY